MASEAEAESNHELDHLVISFKSMNLTSSQWLKTRDSFKASFIIFSQFFLPSIPKSAARIVTSNLISIIALSILDVLKMRDGISSWLIHKWLSIIHTL